jgi:hypothetical protein
MVAPGGGVFAVGLSGDPDRASSVGMSTATKAKSRKPTKPARKAASRRPARSATPRKFEPIEYLPAGAVRLANWEKALMNRSSTYGPEE